MEVAELAEGQSTELAKGQVVRESLMAEEQIKTNAGVDKLNLRYRLRDIDTGLDLARLDTINAINSTTYQSDPNQALFMLQGLGSVASSAQTYYSMPESSRQSWFGQGGGGGGSGSNLPNSYTNKGYRKRRRSSGMEGSSYYKYNVGNR